ncbi:transcriptional repressor [Parasedimentitalea maritima]|uniref:Transcriptional repressor n=2 Tax=Parasedimentitalea TaxID=2738399 RepID=A0A6L6WIF7_9RHOB|nr:MULTISPECIES: transcriptional repressor [Zongyanglinia]MVO17270.1 transcriptional repressor [Zongyanglinia huanghaiensis]TLP62732.1 transcriptional repressor [Zongyanglinia marina]
MGTIGFETHDHSSCINDCVAVVDKHCKAEGLQLTPVRRRVLEILLQEHQSLGAYEILDRLREEGMGSQPPVAYRALDFLVKHGFAHKIERLNAFIACSHPGQSHTPVFMICRECSAVAETHTDLDKGQLGQLARDVGFQIECSVVEAEGLCPKCQQQASA